ncbi:TPA: EpsG family protein [Vibrio vulnificus]|nr:EpsG family protein [Vibrio vulnificus]
MLASATDYYVYLGTLFLAMFFGKLSDSNDAALAKCFCFGSFLCLFFLSALRHYVGKDYANYVMIFRDISNGSNLDLLEPGFYALNYIVSYVANEYLVMFALVSFITYLFFFKLLYDKKIVFLGVLIAFSCGYIFRNNNLIRQGVASAVFMFSISFLEEKKFKTYYSSIVLASLFHYTVLLFLPLKYVLSFFKGKRFFLITLTVLSAILSKFGFGDLLLKVISMIPYYGELYMARSYLLDTASSGTNLVVYMWSLLSIVTIYYRPNCAYSILFSLGSILSLLTLDMSLLYRMSSYLADFKIIAIPLFIKDNLKFNALLVYPSKLFFISILLLLTFLNVKNGISGAVPYNTYM